MASQVAQILRYAPRMALLLLLCGLEGQASRACNACGPECVTACGTAMFRACCFNYNRKRSVDQRDALTPAPLDEAAFETPVDPPQRSLDAWTLLWVPRRAAAAMPTNIF
ncbi:uncharacterized protein LOC8036165 [Ixodes scapularis]|nr:uncharacterized protein LOC8036165 [Ixodes scapularis]